MSKEHANKVLDELSEKLDQLTMQYDSKVLAATLLMRSVHLMKLLMAAGHMRSEEVEKMLIFAATTVAEPLGEGRQPIVVALNPPPGTFAGTTTSSGKKN